MVYRQNMRVSRQRNLSPILEVVPPTVTSNDTQEQYPSATVLEQMPQHATEQQQQHLQQEEHEDEDPESCAQSAAVLSSLGQDPSVLSMLEENIIEGGGEKEKGPFCSRRNLLRWIFLWLWCNTLAIGACLVVKKVQKAYYQPVVYQNNPWKPIGQVLDEQAFQDATQAFRTRYGYAVVMSKDGSVMAVSAPREGDVGSVRIYQWNDEKWNRMGPVLYGTINDGRFGTAVALTENGKRIAVGSPNSLVGQVQVFDFDESIQAWNSVGEPIQGLERNEQLGSSLSFSADGTLLAAGGLGYRSDDGVARVFAYNNQEQQAKWTQLGSALQGTEFSKLGFSLALASSSSMATTIRLVVGAPFDSQLVHFGGLVLVYEYQGNVWNPVGSPLRGVQYDGRYGWSVDISSRGNEVALGSPTNGKGGDAAGMVVVYRYNDSTDDWTVMGQEILGDDIGGWFGNTVALSNDGRRVVGGHWTAGRPGGHVRVLEYNASTNKWESVGLEILGQALFDPYGTSLGFSGDGSRLVSSAFENIDTPNSARVQAFSLLEADSSELI